MRNNRLAFGAALLAALALAMPPAAFAAAPVKKGDPPSMRNSFRIGSGGVLCTAQNR